MGNIHTIALNSIKIHCLRRAEGINCNEYVMQTVSTADFD
jgi:hypothetical protein